MRAFIAVEVPAADATVSRAAPEHLTLRFLGEIPAGRVDPIRQALDPVGAAMAPFTVTLDHVGAFPSSDRPRVVWMGASEGADALAALADRVRSALPEEGDPRDREKFVPHLTLFRVRSPRDRESARALLSGAAPAPPARRFPVAEFVLKESALSPRGATHRTMATFPLRGGQPDSEAARSATSLRQR